MRCRQEAMSRGLVTRPSMPATAMIRRSGTRSISAEGERRPESHHGDVPGKLRNSSIRPYGQSSTPPFRSIYFQSFALVSGLFRSAGDRRAIASVAVESAERHVTLLGRVVSFSFLSAFLLPSAIQRSICLTAGSLRLTSRTSQLRRIDPGEILMIHPLSLSSSRNHPTRGYSTTRQHSAIIMSLAARYYYYATIYTHPNRYINISHRK